MSRLSILDIVCPETADWECPDRQVLGLCELNSTGRRRTRAQTRQRDQATDPMWEASALRACSICSELRVRSWERDVPPRPIEAQPPRQSSVTSSQPVS